MSDETYTVAELAARFNMSDLQVVAILCDANCHGRMVDGERRFDSDAVNVLGRVGLLKPIFGVPKLDLLS